MEVDEKYDQLLTQLEEAKDPHDIIKYLDEINTTQTVQQAVSLQQQTHDKSFGGPPDFTNWGKTVSYIPKKWKKLKSKADVINAIHDAKLHNDRIRVSGFRHSWTPIHGDSDNVQAETIDKWNSGFTFNIQAERDSRDLHIIEVIRSDNGNGTGTVRVGSGVTNEMLRLWCRKHDYHIPLNVILVEISIGGSVSAMCHGAGVNNPTLADIIDCVHYVDHNGHEVELKLTDNEEKFRAVVGSLGLFGILISVDFHLLKGKHLARFNPKAVKRDDGIPRIGDRREQLVKEYERDALKFYSEWFWFPGSSNIWINCWDEEIGEQEKVDEFPGHWQAVQESILTRLSGVLHVLGAHPKKQTSIFSNSAMHFLPTHPMNLQLCDALHFRRGIHTLPVQDVEADIEIPEIDGKIDLDFVRQLWWTAIDAIDEEKHKGNYPVRVALEMRLMGGSKTYMATQYGNKWTCAIEVLSFLEVPGFLGFAERLVDRWYRISHGRGCKLRLHWGKQWVKVNGMEYIDFLKVDMKDQLERFKKEVPNEAWKLFSNETFDKLFSI